MKSLIRRFNLACIFQKQILVFAFVPFSMFWGEHGSTFLDRSKINVAIAPDCAQVSEKNSELFEIEVASKPDSREYGLSNRHTKLTKNNGMLFVFETPQKVSFWMKETYIPLQIAYFNTNDELFELKEMPVEKDPKNPKKAYASSDLVTTALELQPHRLKLGKSKMSLCVKAPTQKPITNSSQVVR